jgi:hypothetical protein
MTNNEQKRMVARYIIYITNQKLKEKKQNILL